MTRYQELEEFITMQRKKQGFTQHELGKACGLSRGSIVNFELGNQKPDLDRIEQMLNFLGYTVELKFVKK